MPGEYGYESSNVEGSRGRRGPGTFYMQNGKETTVVLLDDNPFKIVRHKYMIRGDAAANDMRQTCKGNPPSQHPKPCPRDCLACNAGIRHGDVLKRLELFYLSCIVEVTVSKDGKEFRDSKKFLEMNDEQVDIFRDRRKAHGTLVGARFRVYRGKEKTAERLGSNWTFLGHVELARHFWHSPAIMKIMEAERKKDPSKCPPNRDEHYKKIVFDLVKPFDYEKMIGGYDPAEAEQFIAVVDSPDRAKAASSEGAAGGDAPPPPPPSAQPNYAMPPGATPQYAPAGAPASAPAPQPTGYAPPPPPPVSDPRTATAPAGAPAGSGTPTAPWDGQQTIPGAPGYVPPAPAAAPPPQGYVPPAAPAAAPPPAQAGVPAATTQMHGFQPPSMPTGAPPAQTSAPSAPAPSNAPPGAPAYDFSQGWSQTPPGMGQPPVAAAAAPARPTSRAEDI